MNNFKQSLDRLRMAIRYRPRGISDPSCVVHRNDLSALIRDWERLDFEVRQLDGLVKKMQADNFRMTMEDCGVDTRQKIKRQI